MYRRLKIVGIALMILTLGACSDETASRNNGNGNGANNDSGTGTNNDSGANNDSGTGANNDSGTGANNDSGTGTNNPPCVGLKCQQVVCETSGTTTSISGVVTIPAGTLPLPNAIVYVPNSAVGPIADGASCERCGDALSGDPIVQTTTNILGEFVLENMPVGEDIPVVIQVGKWRRQITIPAVEPCIDSKLLPTQTRLPRNRNEGDIPKIALTTGGADALECLLPKLGLDLSEFTPESEQGRVHFYKAHDGSSRFRGDLNGGSNFTNATSWWDDVNNLKKYDIVLHSCEGQTFEHEKSPQARRALQEYADMGGRIFLSHWHSIWIQEGTPDFKTVANWRNTSSGIRDGTRVKINTGFEKGARLADWMLEVGGSTQHGELPINEGRESVHSVNAQLAQQWISLGNDHSRSPQYFSFNTPVTVPDTDQCGRVVFSDIHVSYGSLPGRPFPEGCSTTEFSPQEKALVFMLFDLSSCIIPDCVRTTCEESGDVCGTIPDGCGGSLECGREIEETCDDNDDCCGELICRAGTCQVASCAPSGSSCDNQNDCCSLSCAKDSGEPTGICVAG